MVAPLAVNPHADIELRDMGDGQQYAIVDDFLVDPDYVREFASQNRSAFEIPERGYPGLTLTVRGISMSEIYRFLRTRMSRSFAFLRGDVKNYSMLAVTSSQPDELSNLQRMCHVDPPQRPNLANFATVLYLFEDENLGGTGFYRWKDQATVEQATALDLEDPERARGFLQEQFATFRDAPRYMTGGNEIADEVAIVPAKFNRLVFYSGDIPHSAYIENPELLTDNPATGRLTLNCFVSAHPGAGTP